MNRKGIHRLMVYVLVSMLIMPWLSMNVIADEGSSIVVDGDLFEWENITPLQGEGVDEWKVVYSVDGNTLYFSYSGTTTNEWDYSYLDKINITYDNGYTGKESVITCTKEGARDNNYGIIDGSSFITINSAHGNTAGPYTVEFSVPMSYFKDQNFSLTFAGNTLYSKSIQNLKDIEMPKEEDPVYNGIVVDGKFNDWAAVEKTDISCPNENHKNCITKTATVFDGDYVYIYLQDGDGSAAGAGTHSNGNYVMTTDLGRTIFFQLNDDGTVSGVEGARCSHVGSQWEIAIPKSELPYYQKSLSFGLYLADPFIKNIINIQEDQGNVGAFEGIVYDGNCSDWNSYPHTVIEYDTAGTQEGLFDADGALYSDGNQLFGHVETTHPEHLQNEAGGEFTQAVTIRLNNDMKFYPRVMAVDENGNINWNPQISKLPQGQYEFYITSLDAWASSPNINDLNEADTIYGKMIINVGSLKDECEYYLDLDKLAEKFNCQTTDFKTIEAQFGRIGDEWMVYSGASSSPFIGIGLCLSVVGGVLLYRKHKKKESQ